MLPYPRHRGSQPCGCYLIAPLTGNKEGCMGLMVLRVKPTPARFPTNSRYTPMDNTPLHSISNVCYPWSNRARRGGGAFKREKNRFACRDVKYWYRWPLTGTTDPATHVYQNILYLHQLILTLRYTFSVIPAPFRSLNTLTYYFVTWILTLGSQL